ncbi:NUMOD3 domain-containing DNA-binding protein [Ensifer adhaerens]|uniref:NUMOD3 domain-containing DNA-binding protein n=1 Tax=Ensifer adhaerens TaxID=106592 RepID=UPI003D01C3D3
MHLDKIIDSLFITIGLIKPMPVKQGRKHSPETRKRMSDAAKDAHARRRAEKEAIQLGLVQVLAAQQKCDLNAFDQADATIAKAIEHFSKK